MKKLIVYSLLLFIFASCSKSEDNIDHYTFHLPLSGENLNEITKIVPVIHLLDGSQHQIGSGNKKETGFDVGLQNPIHPASLYPINSFADFHGAPMIDKKDVPCYGAVSFLAYQGNQYIGTLLSSKSIIYNDPDDVDHFSLHYMYVEEDVTVKGNFEEVNGEAYKSFNLTFQAGWNRYMCIQHTRRGGTTYEYTSAVSEDIPWGLSRR